MKKYIFLILSLIILISSCTRQKIQEMASGKWVGVLNMDDKNPEILLPFNFSYTNNNKDEIIITNAEERIIIQEITFVGDSVFIKLPVFKDEIRAKIVTADVLKGTYLHFGSKSKNSFPFSASLGSSERFAGANKTPAFDVSGRWETIVQPGDSDQYTIIGEFNQLGNNLTGTFLTPSGDYRYLEGAVSGNDLMLSCLDGSHTLLFKATLSDKGTLENGILVGGPTWKEKWRAVKNEKIELPDPEKQSMLKDNIEKIDFSFLDLNGKKISLSDDKYKDKVVILQIINRKDWK